MTDTSKFDGDGDALAWLNQFDKRYSKKNNSYKLKKFSSSLEGNCYLWYQRLPDGVDDKFVELRKAFVAYWIDGSREVNSVTVNPVTVDPLPPSPPEPSLAHPVFSALVSTGILDPRGVYEKVFAHFSQAVDKEKIFRVIWDAAFEAGKQCGIQEGRGDVRGESIEEGKQLGMVLAQREEEKRRAEKEQNQVSVSVDTSDFTSCTCISTSTQTLPSDKSRPPMVPLGNEVSRLDWAEEADTISPAILITPTPAPRDISALRSSSTRHPFGSLQRRARRFQRAMGSPIITRRHSHGLGANRPVQTFVVSPGYGYQTHYSHKQPLDWAGDPRLAELGRILTELGWARQ